VVLGSDLITRLIAEVDDLDVVLAKDLAVRAQDHSHATKIGHVQETSASPYSPQLRLHVGHVQVHIRVPISSVNVDSSDVPDHAVSHEPGGWREEHARTIAVTVGESKHLIHDIARPAHAPVI
jgi:hypothetical protein